MPPRCTFLLASFAGAAAAVLGSRPQLLVWLLTLPVLWQFLYAQRTDALLSLRSARADAA